MNLQFNHVARSVKVSVETYQPSAHLEIENAYLRTLVKQHAPSMEGYNVISTEGVWETIKNILKRIKEWLFGSAKDESEVIKKKVETTKSNVEKVKKEPKAKEKEVVIITSNEELDKFMLGDKDEGEKSESPKKHEPSAIVTSDPNKHYVYSNLSKSMKAFSKLGSNLDIIGNEFKNVYLHGKGMENMERGYTLTEEGMWGEATKVIIRVNDSKINIEITKNEVEHKVDNQVFKLDSLAMDVLECTVNVSSVHGKIMNDLDQIKKGIEEIENGIEPTAKEDVESVNLKLSSLQAHKKVLTTALKEVSDYSNIIHELSDKLVHTL